MKKSFFLLILLAAFSVNIYAQNKKIPSVSLKNLEGKTINTADFNNGEKLMVINFWATWCSPCKRELNNIAEIYPDWVEETGVKIIAISIDDTRNAGKVAPYVNGKAWEYEIYLDSNSDFRRAMNVNNVPHTFLINAKGEVIWEHNSYVEGDEEELYEQILKHSPKAK